MEEPIKVSKADRIEKYRKQMDRRLEFLEFSKAVNEDPFMRIRTVCVLGSGFSLGLLAGLPKIQYRKLLGWVLMIV